MCEEKNEFKRDKKVEEYEGYVVFYPSNYQLKIPQALRQILIYLWKSLSSTFMIFLSWTRSILSLLFYHFYQVNSLQKQTISTLI